MRLDANSTGQPLINVQGSATKVTLGMAAGVAFFFVVSAVCVIWASHSYQRDHRNPPALRGSP